jgi:hypothetical protein
MRKILLFATWALLIATGAAHANSNVYPWSPYAIIPQAGAPAFEATPHYLYRAHPTKGRAAFVYGEPGFVDHSHEWSSVGLPVGSTGDYSNYF